MYPEEKKIYEMQNLKIKNLLFYKLQGKNKLIKKRGKIKGLEIKDSGE